MSQDFLQLKGKGSITGIVKDGRKKYHTTFENNVEMVEEYDQRTDELCVRKFRRPTTLGGEGQWHYEIGEAPRSAASMNSALMESSSMPTIIRQDQRDTFAWRIRNLPYPKDVFDVSVDTASDEVVVRTSIKKYYKRFLIPDMRRAQLKLDPSAVSWTHLNNTLVITYKKPAAILSLEEEGRRERAKVKTAKGADGDMDCKQS